MPTTTAQPEPTTTAAAPAISAGPRLRLAYLTTQYPKVSHTFIRRELLELERRGHTVERFAIRTSGEALADPADQDEQRRTWHCLSQPRGKLLTAALGVMLARPLRAARALRMVWAMARRSERGLLRHLAYFAEAAMLLGQVQQREVRHVHVHFGTNAAAVARLMRTLGGPTYSLTIHGPDEFDAPLGLSLGDKVADAAFVVAISRYGSAQLRRWTPVEYWSKVHVVRCAVSEAFLDAIAPVPPDSRTLVSVGRLSAQKGQLVLLEAFAQLRRQSIDAQLVLAGDGELRQLIEQRIGQLQLTDHVRITGWIDEARVRELLLASRGLVLPSFAEGLPVVLMEALALGRPAISTYVAGIPELVRDGENGWLVPAGDVAALADAMRQMLQAPADRLTAMGRAGHEAVRQQHRLASEVDQLESLLVAASGGVA